MKLETIFRPKLIRAVAFIFGVPIILLAFYLWIYNPFAIGLPKDGSLIALFQDHRNAFENLRAMAIQDSGNTPYFTADSVSRSSLSDSRRGEYERLFSEIGKKFSIGVAPNQVTFDFDGGGTGLSISRSWMKGIVYLPDGNEREGSIVNSLDALGPNVSDGVYLVPIERNWYLIYSQLD